MKVWWFKDSGTGLLIFRSADPPALLMHNQRKKYCEMYKSTLNSTHLASKLIPSFLPLFKTRFLIQICIFQSSENRDKQFIYQNVSYVIEDWKQFKIYEMKCINFKIYKMRCIKASLTLPILHQNWYPVFCSFCKFSRSGFWFRSAYFSQVRTEINNLYIKT